MANPTAAILVIGDEILSGRTREGNAHYLAGELFSRGIDLREIRVIGDDAEVITRTVNRLRELYDHVFTSGGIGPTHDDMTADAVAAAFGVPIDVRKDARALLAARYETMGVPFTPARMRMARIPDGAELIENPVSVAPGFRIGNVHVLAGVPEVFKAMVESILPGLTGGEPLLTRTVMVHRPEGEVADALSTIAVDFPDLSIGSYPFITSGQAGTNLVFRGHDPARIDAAVARWQTESTAS